MGNLKISELPEEADPLDTGLLETASVSGSSFASRRLSLGVLASWIIGKVRQNSSYILGRSGAPISLTGSTTETTLATINIPAGAIGPNGFVEVIPLFTMTGSTNAKTVRVRLNGSEIFSTVITSAATIALRPMTGFNNANSQSAQIAVGGVASGVGQATAISRTTINTAAATTLTITGQIANAGETLTLESYLARVAYGG